MNDREPEKLSEFARIARELECDDDEDRFNATLKKIAPKPKDDDAKETDAPKE